MQPSGWQTGEASPDERRRRRMKARWRSQGASLLTAEERAYKKPLSLGNWNNLREQKCQLHNRKGFECSPEQNSLTAELSNAKGNAARRLHQLWAEAWPDLLQPLPQGSQGSSGICISCLAKQVTQHTHLEFWSADQEWSQNYLMELNLWWTAAVTRKDVHMQDS